MNRSVHPRLRRNVQATAVRVGGADFRRNMAGYLKLAESGRQIIILQRGKGTFMLVKVEEDAPSSVFGCMQDRTQLQAGAVLNAQEDWRAGSLP